MRLALTSDLHGHLPEIPRCDVLLIAGDLCPIENHDVGYQLQWLTETFVPWLACTPARQRLFIAGNHDFVFALEPERVRRIAFPGLYLCDDGTTFEGVSFWGTPWVGELAGWVYTAPEELLRHYWNLIPLETRVLLVHGPPRGYGDRVIGSRTGDVLHVGSATLTDRMEELTQLQLVVCGHIHEAAGMYCHRNVAVVNAALMDVRYRPTQRVQLWELSDPPP